MANTPQERQLFKVSLSKIVNKYGDWIENNRQLHNLIATTDEKFDNIIHFLSPPDFAIFLMQRNFTQTGGCTAAAMTISAKDDDVRTDYQRRIYFNRAYTNEHAIVHELFHYLTHPRFTNHLPINVVEGFTEYFTFKIIRVLGAAGAAEAALNDDHNPVSAYGDYTRHAEQTRKFLKKLIFPSIQRERTFVAEARNRDVPNVLGRHRIPGFVPLPPRISFKDFTKKAYFGGQPDVIQLIKEQVT